MRLALFASFILALPLGAQVKITRAAPDRIVVEIDGKPYTTFYLAPGGNKPYLWPLSTASGAVVTRHFPMEEFAGETKDHPHHRGLFFAHGDINGVNFWDTEPRKGPPPAVPEKNPGTGLWQGSMKLKQVVEAQGGEKSGTGVIRAVFEGLDATGKPIMTDTRTVTFYSDPLLRTIDYEVVIQPLEKLTFRDTKEGTFGIRLATSMTEEKGGGGRMVNAEGKETEKNVWGKRSAWVDYCGPVDGQTVGVAIFDNPANPRYPTYWHSRAYGLDAANIFGVHDFTGDKSQDGSMTIEPGNELHFRYRVVIHGGDTASAKIAELYREYAGRPPAPPHALTLPLKCASGDCSLLHGAPQTAGMRSGFVRLKPGDSVGWHTTEQNEESLVILHGQGDALIEGEPGRSFTAPGFVYIPPATRHNVKNTGGEVLEYVYVVAPAKAP